jgi:hypothetical protein
VIAVRTTYWTHADGSPVDPDTTSEEDWPTTYHGPFDTMAAALDWMDNVYPDGDTDVEDQDADDYDIPTDWLNSPESVTS